MAENFNIMNTVYFEPGELSINCEDDCKESAYEIRYVTVNDRDIIMRK